MLVNIIRADPGYDNGNYKEQPASLKLAATFFSLATSGGTQNLQKQAPTREQADKVVEARLAQRFSADANDYIYSYEAARDYDPSPDLEKITARVLAINAADDERNPAELGILNHEIRRVKNGRMYLIRASAETRGHGTTGDAKFWKHLLPPLLSDATLAGQ
jgi:homoserine O-acetyltransferase